MVPNFKSKKPDDKKKSDSETDEVILKKFHKSPRTLSEYLPRTRFGGLKTFDCFMIVDPGAFYTIVFFVHHFYSGYFDRLLETDKMKTMCCQFQLC